MSSSGTAMQTMGYSRQWFVALPYVIQQRYMKGQKVRSAISATAGLVVLSWTLHAITTSECKHPAN